MYVSPHSTRGPARAMPAPGHGSLAKPSHLPRPGLSVRVVPFRRFLSLITAGHPTSPVELLSAHATHSPSCANAASERTVSRVFGSGTPAPDATEDPAVTASVTITPTTVRPFTVAVCASPAQRVKTHRRRAHAQDP